MQIPVRGAVCQIGRVPAFDNKQISPITATCEGGHERICACLGFGVLRTELGTGLYVLVSVCVNKGLSGIDML